MLTQVSHSDSCSLKACQCSEIDSGPLLIMHSGFMAPKNSHLDLAVAVLGTI